jgi:hypothetical protein
MRRLRPLTEEECYARCYFGWEATVRVIRLDPRRARHTVLLDGEALRRRFEEALDAREPGVVAEEAA